MGMNHSSSQFKTLPNCTQSAVWDSQPQFSSHTHSESERDSLFNVLDLS